MTTMCPPKYPNKNRSNELGVKSTDCTHSLTEATKVAILLKDLNTRIEASIDRRLNLLISQTTERK